MSLTQIDGQITPILQSDIETYVATYPVVEKLIV